MPLPPATGFETTSPRIIEDNRTGLACRSSSSADTDTDTNNVVSMHGFKLDLVHLIQKRSLEHILSKTKTKK